MPYSLQKLAGGMEIPGNKNFFVEPDENDGFLVDHDDNDIDNLLDNEDVDDDENELGLDNDLVWLP